MHIPFCDSKCHYCAFNSYVDKFELKEAYMQALRRQLVHDLEHLVPEGTCIDTLFIGGGTPSTVPPAYYAPIFEALANRLAPDAEITSEANPNSATQEWLEGMRRLGVNRISFGVQSFFDDKLKFLGRAHKASEAIAAVERARKVGFDRLSLDVIYATALDTNERIEEEVCTALSLPIEHLSAYELTIEENTPFAERPEVWRESIDQARTIATLCENAGLDRYEVSNFGRPCRHNLGYWRYEPYLGIGAGAVGRVGTRRLYPHRPLERYIESPLHKEVEGLDTRSMVEERIFLGLRSVVGIDPSILDEEMKKRADLLVTEKKLLRKGGRYHNLDYLIADEIALFILD